MPVYNGQQYIAQAIECVLRQTMTDLELIISDNASTDATPEICRTYVESDPRVRYVRQERNLGAPANYQFVREQARGEYFKWAAANDLFDDRLLERCLEVLQGDPGVVLCYPRTRLIDRFGNAIGDYDDRMHLQEEEPSRRFIRLVQHLRLNNPLNGVIRMDVLRQCRPLGRYLSSDVHLVAELSLRGRFHELPEVMFYRRLDNTAATVGKSQRELIEIHQPGSRRRVDPTFWRLDLGNFPLVFRAPIAFSEKLRLFRYLLRQLVWHRDKLAAEAGAVVKQFVTRH